MANRSNRMVEFLKSRVEKGTRAWKRASLTAKSYLLQEAESTSRLAKIDWCKEKGIQVMSLQHDGIMMGIGPERYEEARKGMSQSATKASGYNVEVVIKGIEEKNGGGSKEGAWDMPPLRATRTPERRGGKNREVLSTGGILLPPRGGWESEEDEKNGLLYRDDSEDEDTNVMLHEAWAGGTSHRSYGQASDIQHGTPNLGETIPATEEPGAEAAPERGTGATDPDKILRKWAASAGLSHTNGLHYRDDSEDEDMSTMLNATWIEEGTLHGERDQGNHIGNNIPEREETVSTMKAGTPDAGTGPERGEAAGTGTDVDELLRRWATSVGLSHTYRKG